MPDDILQLQTDALSTPMAGRIREQEKLVKLFQEGMVLYRQGNLTQARMVFERILARDPRHFDALHLLGVIAHQTKNPQRAADLLGRALEIKPDSVAAYNNRGSALKELQRYDEALASYDKAIALKPDYAIAYFNRGNALNELWRYSEAIASFHRAIAIMPNHAVAYYNCGNAFLRLQRFDEALDAYGKAIAIKPDYAEAYNNAGTALFTLKRYAEAFAAYDKALSLMPDLEGAEGMRLRAKMHFCNWNNLTEEISHLSRSIRDGKVNSTPFALLALTESPEEHLVCARSYISKTIQAPARAPQKARSFGHSRLRLGYLSTDFRSHPVAQALCNVVELHDRSRFEVVGISIGPRDQSDLGERLISALDSFHDIRFKNDRETAASIENLEIDILLMTAVWTEFSRPGILAHRPSPIQVNFFAPYTSGADFFDYIVADPRGILPEERQYYSERVAYVSGFANDTTQAISDVRPKRTEQGLPDDAFVFSCFNAYYKLHPQMFDTLMSILRRVDGSVLWLMSDPAGMDNLKAEAIRRGIDPSRLVFAPHMPSFSDHLARVALADLCLDTLPQGAHTTARDALYAGVPVLTQTGKTFVGRIGSIQLEAVGLPELITKSKEEYEDLAVVLATSPGRLRKIRETLNANKPTAALFNSELYVRDLEASFEAMYRRYQAGLPPDHIIAERSAAAR